MSDLRVPSRAFSSFPLRAAATLSVLATTLSAQIWSEEFDTPGAPDPAIWSYDIGAGGWGNNELQTYTSNASNVRVEGGQLVITASRSGTVITSGRIRSQSKLTFQYGTVEARIQMPDLQDGLWPAFWTLGDNIDIVSWPDCGEIDIVEMGSSDAIANNVVNRRVYSTAHWESNNSRALYGLSRTLPSDIDGTFRVWRLEWTPWALSTYIDDQWVWTMDISNPASFDGQEFHAPHFFVANLAVGGNYPNIFNRNAITAPLPAEYRIDYIRLYDNGHTIMGGSGWAGRPAATATRREGAGNHSIYVCAPPVIGAPMSAFLSVGALPYQLGGVFAHLGASSFPFGNYTILVDLASPAVFSLPLKPFQYGIAAWTLPIPNDQALSGLQITTQGALVGPDLGFTNAVDLQLGN